MYIRRNKKYTTEPLEDDMKIVSSSDSEEEYLLKEQNRQLYAAMRKLKSEYAQALWLMYFEDLSIKEIASVMKKSPSTVKMLLHRARPALKAELEKDGLLLLEYLAEYVGAASLSENNDIHAEEYNASYPKNLTPCESVVL